MNAPRAGIFLSARMKSTRLPNKQMLEINGRPITAHLIDRLKKAKRASIIVMATSDNPQDQPLVDLAEHEGIASFCGSPEDKLDRYLKAGQKFGVEFITVVDGDDPFCDPNVIDAAIETYQREQADYITGKDLPLGVTCHAVSMTALEKVCQLKLDDDVELWGDYFTKTGLFRVRQVEMDPFLRRPDLRMTMDYPEDFEFFKAVFQRLYKPGQVFSLRDVITLLDQHPEIVKINSGVNARYEQNLKRISKPIRLRSVSGSAS